MKIQCNIFCINIWSYFSCKKRITFFIFAFLSFILVPSQWQFKNIKIFNSKRPLGTFPITKYNTKKQKKHPTKDPFFQLKRELTMFCISSYISIHFPSNFLSVKLVLIFSLMLLLYVNSQCLNFSFLLTLFIPNKMKAQWKNK